MCVPRALTAAPAGCGRTQARARLANTKGKKAKRKAREKQLEEARRLASLQKKRELKAAGIETTGPRRKKKGIDYNAEIPFQMKPPPGFYDTGAEAARKEEEEFRPKTMAELQGTRRADIEAVLLKADKARNKIAQRHDLPSQLDKINELNDVSRARKRSKLNLPAPQVTEEEMAELSRLEARGGGYDPRLLEGAGGAATQALLGSYENTPQRLSQLRTPLRTPTAGVDAVRCPAPPRRALPAAPPVQGDCVRLAHLTRTLTL